MVKTSGRFIKSLKVGLMFLAIIWTVHMIQWVLNISFYQIGGVYPRTISGMPGILLSPFLHGSFMHLINNSAPLLVLTVIIIYFFKDVATESLLLIYVLTGVMVWLFARPVYHIGASGVVYGMVSFVFWCGIFVRNIKTIILALIVAILYSGMFLGVLPNQEGISWESHLMGGVIGIFVAYIMRDKIKNLDPPEQPKWEDEGPSRYFFDRDVFGEDSNDDNYWRT